MAIGHLARAQKADILPEPLAQIEKAAALGNAIAQMKLGEMYATGKGVKEDDAKATELYHKAAAQGNADAQYNLGRIYRFGGKGIHIDAEKATDWFRKAADLYQKAAQQGNVEAQRKLGQIYHRAEGVEHDESEAVKWYEKASEQGDSIAQFILGAMYNVGGEVPKDDVKAFKWFRKAAEQGLASAQHSVGNLYSTGHGVAKDEIEGLAWLNIAASSPDEPTYFLIRDRDEAEVRVGRQATLVAQQRSKEILKEIAAAKQAKDSSRIKDATNSETIKVPSPQ